VDSANYCPRNEAVFSILPLIPPSGPFIYIISLFSYIFYCLFALNPETQVFRHTKQYGKIFLKMYFGLQYTWKRGDINAFKDKAQTALFKDPVRTAQ